eukprot:XP_001695898.1 peptidyl-prolyl cis-trans isomerase, FKBP-type [Chlamydomonas reinhardtii]
MLLNSRTPTVSSRAPQQSLAAALKVAYVPLVASTNSVVGPALASSTASTASRCQTSRIAVPIPIVVCCSSSQPATTEDDVVRYAAVGDIVSINFVMRDEDGKVLQSSETDLGEPLAFEVGAGDMMGNRLFQGFDEAVRGMAVGQTTVLEASGGEWKRELLFAVPRDHPEVARLEGRYKNVDKTGRPPPPSLPRLLPRHSQGGLAAGLVVELANGAMAVILEVNDAEVKLDANNMLAGKTFTIELELVSIDAPAAEEDAAAAATA